MSLKQVSESKIIKNQLLFKLNSFTGVFTSMLALQLLAIFMSYYGSSSMGGGGVYGISYTFSYYSANVVIAFTFLWIFVNSILITTRAYKEDDFHFVTNRMTQNLSNILFLFVASLIGAVTAMLSSFLVKILIYFFKATKGNYLAVDLNALEWFTGLAATILILFMLGSFGYFIGILVQWYKKLAIILPVVLIGTVMALASQGHYILPEIIEFYFMEHSFIVFLLKVIGSAGVLFAAAILISNQQEVRK
ncbi:hypothetical protein [Ornithinibacillus halophilus]|uniref:Uncharacterized protein n=1 Tax=Ornithinibacillus halophilus TaxID=930117 RepID=A0A1M5KY46_9BACI|nr:hypothetical protein [Ornithinibacillus halophilus]SHG57681.1 hypothetical protein SAMN05216225_104223 [Ornithinibacillus halophilus]